MPIQRKVNYNDTTRWREIKRLNNLKEIRAYASTYGLAVLWSREKVLSQHALNAEVACKAADFAQMVYIPYNQRTDMKQTWSPKMMASYLKCSPNLRWYCEHPLYSKGLMWLLAREDFVRTDPRRDRFKLTIEEGAVILQEPKRKPKRRGLRRRKVSETFTRQLAFFEARSHIKNWQYHLFDGIAGLASRKALEPFGLVAKGQLTSGDIVFIAFRGTQGDPLAGPSAEWNVHDSSVRDRNLQDKLFSPDWWTDLKDDSKVGLHDKEVFSYFDHTDHYKRAVWGKVHKGFRDVYASARNQMLQSLSDMGMPPATARQMRKYPPICVTGHSLGAALSILCTADLYCLGYNLVLYNFASPRVGDHAFAEWFNTNISIRYNRRLKTFGAWRINQKMDPVPHIPVSISNFKHIMNLWQINRSGSHDMEQHVMKTYQLSNWGTYKAIKTSETETVTVDRDGDVIDSRGRKIMTDITVKGHRAGGLKAPINLGRTR